MKPILPTGNASLLDLLELAAKYVWWKAPDEAVGDELHLLAMLMTYGTLEDTQRMLATYPRSKLLEVLEKAPPGVFNGRSWAFWHLWLGLPVTPLPERRLPP